MVAPPKCAVNRYCTLYTKKNLKKSKKTFAKVRKLQNKVVSLHYQKQTSTLTTKKRKSWQLSQSQKTQKLLTHTKQQ